MPKSNPMFLSPSMNSNAFSELTALMMRSDTAWASSSSSMSIEAMMSNADSTACSALPWKKSVSTCLILSLSISIPSQNVSFPESTLSPPTYSTRWSSRMSVDTLETSP